MKPYILFLFFTVGLISAMSTEENNKKETLREYLERCDVAFWSSTTLDRMNESENQTCDLCNAIIELAQEKGSLKFGTFGRKLGIQKEDSEIPKSALILCAGRCPGFAEKLNSVLPGQDALVLTADLPTTTHASIKRFDYELVDARVLVKLMATRPELIEDLVKLAEYNLRPWNDGCGW